MSAACVAGLTSTCATSASYVIYCSDLGPCLCHLAFEQRRRAVIFAETPLSSLQLVQNATAWQCLLSQTGRCDHITLVLYIHELHWLPVRQKVTFKVLLVTYKPLHNLVPQYLVDLLSRYRPIQSLWPSDSVQLTVPLIPLRIFGRRAFAGVAPELWNTYQLLSVFPPPSALLERRFQTSFAV